MKIPCIRALIVIAVIIITIIIIMPICKTCAVIITHPDYTLLELFNMQYVCVCVCLTLRMAKMKENYCSDTIFTKLPAQFLASLYFSKIFARLLLYSFRFFFAYLLNFDISNIYNKFCFFSVHSPIVVRQTIIDNKNFIVLNGDIMS